MTLGRPVSSFAAVVVLFGIAVMMVGPTTGNATVAGIALVVGLAIASFGLINSVGPDSS